MTRLTALKRLFVAGLLATGIVAACRAVQPGEAPPLAPRPDPTSPVPSSSPVPGAPDPISPGAPGGPHPSLPPGSDAGITNPPPSPGPVSMLVPEIRGSAQTLVTSDAGAAPARPDGGAAPPAPDAGARSDGPPVTPDAAIPLDASPIDAYTPNLPPVSDASLAPVSPDAGRPY